MADRARTAPLKPLSDYMAPAERPSVVPSLVLLVAALVAAVSMPLAWHHHDVPAAGYTIVYGIQGANWLVVVAVICAAFAVRFLRNSPGFYAKWSVTFIAFAVTLGMFADYLDSQDNAAQIFVKVYNGPGFYLGVVLVPVVISAAVAAWRTAIP